MATAVNRVELASIRLGNDLSRVAERLRRATVQVRDGSAPGSGSGVIWSPDGLVVTNAHVARSPVEQVILSDGREFTAKLVARDARRDLAAMRIEGTVLGMESLPTLTVRDATSLRAGEVVVAIGHPWGELNALAVGMVHRAVRSADSMLAADLRLAPGNSGGPLADAEGQLVGINSMIMNGFALAMPTNAVTVFLRAAKARAA
jgi:serine protease Do